MSILECPPYEEGRIWFPITDAQYTAAFSTAECLMFGGAAGPGKMVPLDLPVPTPKGWTTIGALLPGSQIFDEQGDVCTVTFLSPIAPEPKSLRLTFDDGTIIDACDDHLWLTYDARELVALTKLSPEYRARRRIKRPSRANALSIRSRNISLATAKRNRERIHQYKSVPQGTVRNTRQILDTLFTAKGRSNHAIPVAGALKLPQADLLIDPYVLGAWLGDGSKSSGGFTGVDSEVWQEIEAAGYRVSHQQKDPQAHYILGLRGKLRSLSLLRNKHIPAQYLRASIPQRLALLQGLMDTDGHCDTKSGRCEFSNTSRRLAEGLFEIVISLGIKATMREGVAMLKGRATGPKWRICFTTAKRVFRLKRKLARLPKASRRTTQFRYIVKCERVASKPMRCIQVDSPRRLYLVGETMVPTHNTSYIIADAAREYDNPNLSGLILRESFPQLEKSVMPKMKDIYTQMGAYYVGGVKRVWTFPSGAQIRVGVISKPDDIANYQGGSYSFIGIDESTYHPEAHLRDLIPWWRTTDPSLQKRIRLATNPGGIGAPWHMHVFLNGSCPVHFPNQSVEPGAVYRNSTWHSDGAKIPFTTAFIPGKHTDHNLLGDEYGELLRTQSGDRAEQLLEGCWCSLSGSFFSFLRPSQVVPLPEAPIEWWHVHYIGLDFGFGLSSAAAGLFCRSEPTARFPAGRRYMLDEAIESKMGSTEFAEAVCERFVAPTLKDRRRKIVAVYLDPANFKHADAGESVAEQMQEVFDRYDIPVLRASNDRLGGSQRLYRALKSGELTLTSAVPRTFKSLTTRLHDPKAAGTYKKIHGDPLDDIADMVRYAENTFGEETVKPDEIQIEDRMTELREKGLNETSLFYHRMKMMQEMEQRDAPITMGGRRNRR
jgi:hypothetical protein